MHMYVRACTHTHRFKIYKKYSIMTNCSHFVKFEQFVYNYDFGILQLFTCILYTSVLSAQPTIMVIMLIVI